MPIVRVLPVALRLGAVAATAAVTAWTLRRTILARAWTGRTDQRHEDALDDLDEGLAFHRPAVGGEGAEDIRQTNLTARFRRTVQLGERRFEIDAGALARLRIKRI